MLLSIFALSIKRYGVTPETSPTLLLTIRIPYQETTLEVRIVRWHDNILDFVIHNPRNGFSTVNQVGNVGGRGDGFETSSLLLESTTLTSWRRKRSNCMRLLPPSVPTRDMEVVVLGWMGAARGVGERVRVTEREEELRAYIPLWQHRGPRR
jgi:hypothetical protein